MISDWVTLTPNTYWGKWFTDFVMRTQFQVPDDWDRQTPVALYLPLGTAGDFSHPEALAYVDGQPYGTCDRHHQEISLPSQWHDGRPHQLALHGWTGLGARMRPNRRQLPNSIYTPALLCRLTSPRVTSTRRPGWRWAWRKPGRRRTRPGAFAERPG